MAAPIAREELRAAIDAGAVTVVDALPAAPYAARHLPSALNLVSEEVEAGAPRLLPDPAAAIVVYSTDAGCTRAPALADDLERLGYTGVRLYRRHRGLGRGGAAGRGGRMSGAAMNPRSGAGPTGHVRPPAPTGRPPGAPDREPAARLRVLREPVRLAGGDGADGLGRLAGRRGGAGAARGADRVAQRHRRAGGRAARPLAGQGLSRCRARAGRRRAGGRP